MAASGAADTIGKQMIDVHTRGVYYGCMTAKQSLTHERVNISLPKETLRLIDRITRNTNRSGFLNRAARFYIAETSRTNLKARLRAGALARRSRDTTIAEAWFPVEL